MIYYWLHIICIFIGSKFFWKEVDLTADLSRERRVRILDCETLRNMANSKYLYYMDFIRFEILFRTKLLNNTVQKGIYPVLGSQKIIYKKPLKMGSLFTITLILDGWDEKWVYHKQIFTQKGEVCAVGCTKVTFWKNHKAQNIPEILKNCGVTLAKKTPSEELQNMFDCDHDFLREVV